MSSLKAKKRTAAAVRGRPAPKVRPHRGGPAEIELISIGRDLLRGQVENRDAVILGDFINRRGGRLRRITVVDDAPAAIAGALREALRRNPNLLVTTGGLGPAPDDQTLAAVSEVLEAPLAAHVAARSMIEQAYGRMQRSGLASTSGVNAAREKLYRVPIGATPIANAAGIAPGVLCRLPGGAAVLCLPGRPEEMQAVLQAAWPMLKDLGPRGEVARREVQSPTADESAVRPLLERLAEEFPALWISSRPPDPGASEPRVTITLEATAPTKLQATSAVETALHRLLALAGGRG
jgi:molybdenum cofactor synthesis domain-containing protein